MIPNELISSDSLESLLFYFTVMGILLIVSVFLRIKIKILKKYFIPASLIAGFLGLILGPYGLSFFSKEMVDTWGAISGILITIVFAPMLIGMKSEKKKGTARLVTQHLFYSYTGSLLQLSIPLIVSGVIIIPLFNINEMFASIIEVGWAGGHGTAAGMLDVYTNLGWKAGGSLGVTSATIGIVLGIISGIIIINHGVKKGYTSIITDPEQLSDEKDTDIISDKVRTASSKGTLNPDLVEGFAFHMGLIAIAVLIGWFLQRALDTYVPGIPLFPLAMIGGFIVNLVIKRTKYINIIDLDTFKRIQGFALDFLIIGAVASIEIPVVFEYAIPLIILLGVTLGMMIWYFYFLGKRFFDDNWFENAIVHYGSYTGVAAVGLLLLRTSDPEMETDSGKAYALRAPLYSPFLGGGLITSIIPVLMLSNSSLIIGLISLAILIVLLIIAKLLGLLHKPAS